MTLIDRGPRFIEQCYRILLFLAFNGSTKKNHIILRVKPKIDKPKVYKALKRLHEEGWITFQRRKKWGPERGVYSEISRKGLLELLRYCRGPTATALRKRIFDIIAKSPGLNADEEWVNAVRSLIPLLVEMTPWAAGNFEGNVLLPMMIWQEPRDAVRELIRSIQNTGLGESNAERIGLVVAERIRELQNILRNHPKYAALATQIIQEETKRINDMQDHWTTINNAMRAALSPTDLERNQKG